jgi:N-acetylglucosamine kinase-like BadF-type ATPase
MNVIGLAEKNDRCTAAIMGTGSIAYAWDGESLHRTGGWGYLFEESGSGYSIGRDMISLALAAEDGLAERGEAVRLVEAKLGTKPFESIHTLYKMGSDYIASFAPLAFEAMEAGDADAEKIIRKAAWQLSRLIVKSTEEYGTEKSVIISGGIAMKQEKARMMLRDELPQSIQVEFATLPPIFGAMRRCLDLSKKEYDFKKLSESFIKTYNKCK